VTEVVGPFWKSSYSGQENNCIEVAVTATGGRAIRDSKNQPGPSLYLSPDGWHAFLTGTKNGELGHSTHS
jgi:hypothetical protein